MSAFSPLDGILVVCHRVSIFSKVSAPALAVHGHCRTFTKGTAFIPQKTGLENDYMPQQE